MSSIKIKITGAVQLGEILAKMVSKDDVKAVVKQNGAELQDKMQENAESAFTRGYSTGQTKRSITLKLKDDGLTAEVQPGTDYAAYVEYGTRFMEAEPFVKPAFDAQMGQFKTDMDKLIK